MDSTNERVKELLKEQILAGKYKLGELIVPQIFEKVTFKNNELITEEVVIRGRMISLDEIRNDMLIAQKKCMRLTTDSEFDQLDREAVKNRLKNIHEFQIEDNNKTTEELCNTLKKYERSRNLMFWHDGSSLSSHGHILMLVSSIYDPAVYLTDDEYSAKYSSKINVQSRVEKPHLYILARCPSTDQQLLYTEERINDILKLKDPVTVDGIEINDTMRNFKGDHPASQFEAGQRKGGNYACHGCGINSHCIKSYVHAFKCKTLSLKNRVDKILDSVESIDKIKQGKVKLYNDLSKVGIMMELNQRQVKGWHSKSTKEQMSSFLEVEMHGIQRLPALMHTNPFKSLEHLNLNKYEILVNEPLHDISNHIKNIQSEIPYHVDKNIKSDVQNIIKASFNNKEAKNSVDHRKSLLMITNWFIQNHKNNFITSILRTLCEIQEILYSPDNKRSSLTILRLIITNFKHAMLLKVHIDGAVKSMTERKFFGIYYHSLIKHSSEQYRLFSGRATNTEKEEATFSPLKTFTKLTSNHQPDNVISNAIIRLQATQLLNTGNSDVQLNDSKINFIYKPIKETLINNMIKFKFIERFPFHYQTMLEQIADYLIEGVWWEEKEDGVVFFDLHNENANKKQLQHFRSTTIVESCDYVDKCWKLCIKKADEKIPSFKIKIPDEKGNFTILKLSTLKFYNDYAPAEILDQHTDDINEMEIINTTKMTTTQYTNEASPSNTTIDINNTPNTPTHSYNKASNETPERSDPFKESTSEATVNSTINSTINISESLKTCVTSTPRAKPPKTLNFDDNPIISLQPKLKQSEAYSKSSEMLVKVFGNKEFIAQFDKNRKALKNLKTKQTTSNYKDSLAVIEIEISKEEGVLKQKFKAMELRLLQENEGCDVFPCEDGMNRDRYNQLLMKLKYIRALKNGLQL